MNLKLGKTNSTNLRRNIINNLNMKVLIQRAKLGLVMKLPQRINEFFPFFRKDRQKRSGDFTCYYYFFLTWTPHM